MKASVFLSTAITVLIVAAKAGASAPRDLFSLSLEQLMTIEVISQQPETIKNAPGIVSTYRADDLREIGLTDLKDFLDFVPGVRVNESLTGTSPIAIRGLWDSNNQKILFLLDGVPFWSPAHADIPLLGIPLASIDRIEVMRGPSAVIYGTNASAGVINIITRRQDRHIEATLGEHGLANVGAHGAFNPKQDVVVNVGFELQNEEGFAARARNTFSFFDPSCGCFPADSSGFIQRAEEKLSFIGNVTVAGFSAMANVFESSITGSADGSLIATQERLERAQLVAAKYRQKHARGHWDIFADWNRYDSHLDVDNITLLLELPGDGEISFANDGSDNIRARTGMQIEAEISGKLRVLLGAEYEERSTEDYKYVNYEGFDALQSMGFELQPDGSILLIAANSVTEKSGYVQVSYRSPKLYLQAGGRHVNNSMYGSKNLPRVSMVVPFAEHHSLKAVYAVGFNSPVFRQVSSVDQYGLPIDTELTAELIETFDVAYTYTADEHHWVANAFYLTLRDGIVEELGAFSNSADLHRHGVELDYQYRHGDLRLYSGATYLLDLDSVEDALTSDLQFAEFTSHWQIELGVSKAVNAHQFGMALRAAAARHNVDSYYWLNASYEYRLRNWVFTLAAENILSATLEYPDVRSKNEQVFQGVDKNRLSARVRFNF